MRVMTVLLRLIITWFRAQSHHVIALNWKFSANWYERVQYHIVSLEQHASHGIPRFPSPGYSRCAVRSTGSLTLRFFLDRITPQRLVAYSCPEGASASKSCRVRACANIQCSRMVCVRLDSRINFGV